MRKKTYKKIESTQEKFFGNLEHECSPQKSKHRNELAGNSKQVQSNPQNPKQRNELASNSKHISFNSQN